MQIEVVLTPTLYSHRQMHSNHATVVVDVLRATTAICAAFHAGATNITPLQSLDALSYYHQQGYTIAAERNGAKVIVEDVPATCGNSPTEYLNMDLQNQRLAYSTTNGTLAIHTAAHDSRQLYIGSFANLSVLSKHLLRHERIVILCSGWKGDPCIEDTLFAGALCKILTERNNNAILINDTARYSTDLWSLASPDLYSFCSKATHVHRLQHMGYDNDIHFALQIDTCPVVPYATSENGSIVLQLEN